MTLLTRIILTALLALAVAGPAAASEMVARDASNVTLKVDEKGQALVQYVAKGRSWNLLAWGAVNARDPGPYRQVAFKLDYAGGWKTTRKALWKTFRNACQPYDGPALPNLVTACKAPDGSYWALQSWQRMLPNLGYAPWKKLQRARELHLSHWTGPIPQLDVYLDYVDWGNRIYHHLFGKFSYNGKPIFGFASTRTGAPLDDFGRNVYLDTLDSAYGYGWKRENSFLAHRPNGNFCYGFYPHDPYAGYPSGPRRPAGNGKRYRMTAMGPGVTPIVAWEGDGLPDWDPGNPDLTALDADMDALADTIHAGDDQCKAR